MRVEGNITGSQPFGEMDRMQRRQRLAGPIRAGGIVRAEYGELN
jgi:hypothetical protein